MIIKEDKLQNVFSLFVEIESHKNFNKLEMFKCAKCGDWSSENACTNQECNNNY